MQDESPCAIRSYPLRSCPVALREMSEILKYIHLLHAQEAGLVSVHLNTIAADFDVSPHENLNLCSAFAHVVADTMRTITVMTCAILASVRAGLLGIIVKFQPHAF